MDDARQLLVSFYPELGQPLPERSYADECSLYTPGHPDGAFHNFMDKMDVFVACHFFGWFVKVCMLAEFLVTYRQHNKCIAISRMQ